MTLTLIQKKKSLTPSNTHEKYVNFMTYYSKVMPSVGFFFKQECHDGPGVAHLSLLDCVE